MSYIRCLQNICNNMCKVAGVPHCYIKYHNHVLSTNRRVSEITTIHTYQLTSLTLFQCPLPRTYTVLLRRDRYLRTAAL